MKFRQKWTPVLALLLMLLAGQTWSGTTDIEYLPTTSAGHDFNHAPVGQTFVARAPWVKAGLYLADSTSFTNWLATIYPGQILPGSYPYAVAPSITVNVKLLTGEGATGTVLDSTDLTLTAPFMGFVDIDYSVLGIELRVGDSYTLLVSDISGQAYPNGVVGWVVPAVSDYSTGASLPPGAYPGGHPILQGTLITNEAGIGDNAFHVIDLYPGDTTTPPTEVCSGTNAVITAVGRKFIEVNGGLNLADRVWFAPRSATTFTGGTTKFVTGELVSYSGTLDPVAGCYASTMTVMPAPTSSSCTAPDGAVEAHGKGRITALGSDFIMIGNTKISFLPCTTLSYKDYATSFTVGQRVEWQGYSANGNLIADMIAAQ